MHVALAGAYDNDIFMLGAGQQTILTDDEQKNATVVFVLLVSIF